MSDPGDLTDDAAEILAEFLDALEHAEDPEALVATFSERRPDLASHFRDEAKFDRVLRKKSQAAGPFGDLQALPDFRIVRWIATGGMGVVYEAEQLSLGRRVALKVRYGSPSPERLERFLREQKTLARLHQSHIVPIHVSGQHEGRHYFAMSFIDGVTLHCLIREARRRLNRDPAASLPTLPELLRERSAAALDADIVRPARMSDRYFRSVALVMADVAEALDFAHGADVVHRDIKPANILLDVSGHCWLIDFGVSHLSNGTESPEFDSVHGTESLTRGPMGTPEYMAPEQHSWAGGEASADLRTDVWGLGATLFELLTLERPFPGRTSEEIRGHVLEGSPRPMASLVANVPADLAAICGKALAKSKEQRYPRAAEFAADLRHWLRGEPTSVRPASAVRAAAMWSRRNKGWATAVLASVLVAALVAVSWIVSVNGASREQKLRADAAEERIREQQWKAKLQERESLIHALQRTQLIEHRSGWSNEAWNLVAQAGAIRKDDRLRDLAIATLQGFDIRLVKRVGVPGSSIAFDPSGNRLAVGGIDASTGRTASPAFLWEGESKRDTKRNVAGPVAFHPQSGPVQLVASTSDLEVRNLETESVIRTIATDSSEVPSAIVISLHGDRIAATWANSGKTTAWDVGTGRRAASLDLGGNAVTLSDDGEFLAVEDAKRHEIVVLHLKANTEVARLPADSLPLRSLAFGRNPRYGDKGLMLASGEMGGAVAVWNLATKALVNRYRGSARDVTALAFSPDGTLLGSGGREECRLWDVATGKLLLRFHGPNGMDYVTGIAFRADGKQLAVSTLGSAYPPSVSVWELRPDPVSHRLFGLSGQIELIAIAPDGKHVAALAQNWEVGVWNLEEQRLCGIHSVPPGAYADNGCLIFSDDSKSLLYSCASSDATDVRQWDVATGKELRRWSLPPGLQNKMAFDAAGGLWHVQVELPKGEPLPGQKTFTWREFPRLCRVRNLTGGEPRKVEKEIRDFNRYVFRIDMSADARRLAIEGRGGHDGEGRWMKLFDRKTCEPTWSYTTKNTMPFANLIFDAKGTGLVYSPDNDSNRSVLADATSGATRCEMLGTPMAVSGGGEWYLIPIWNNQVGSFVMRRGLPEPIANLALDSTMLSVAIDPAGRLMACGSRQGRLDVCDFPEMRKRLESVGLE